MTLWQDTRYGLRGLVRKPGFALAAVTALALGIGANTAIFSVVNAVLLKPLPYHDSERLVTLGHWYPSLNLLAPISAAGYFDYQKQSAVFEDFAISANANYNLTDGGEPERLQGRRVNARFFPLLGYGAARGRTFQPGEEEPGQSRVVVLSHGLWQRRFGSNPEVLNKTINLNGEPYMVIGIMPDDFRFGRDELWTPMAFTPEQLSANSRGNEYLGSIARLKPGVTLERAQAEMAALSQRLSETNPDSYPRPGAWELKVKSLRDDRVGDVRPALLVLLGAVGFLLAIACANVANLLLARATGRRREIAVRAALGAGRARLIRQMLTESVLLALAGGVCGAVLAVWGVDLLLALNENNIPRAREVGVDLTVLGFTFGISVLTGLLFGLIPALQASRTELTAALKEGTRGSAGGFQWWSARSLLVVSEVAVALVLLVGAGLLIKSFARLLDVNPGFQTDNLLTADLSLPQLKYREEAQVRNFYRQLIERVRALPGVQTAGATTNLPLNGSVWSGSFSIEGRPTSPERSAPHSDRRVVTSDYLAAMKIPLLRGRFFNERDNEAAPDVVIVDETLARAYWPGEDPVGRRISFGPAGDSGPRWRQIVGVVGPVRHKALDADYRGQLYIPHGQLPAPGMTLVVRAGTDPIGLVPAVRETVRALDPDQPLYNVRTMREVFDLSIAQRRFSVMLLGLFAGVALLLAMVGLYGVISYSVTQRTHELGIRVALGARPRDVLGMVLRQGAMLAAAGVAAGLGMAFLLTRAMAGLLYGVSATDPLIFVVAALSLAAVALLASYVPARRATRVDPLVALRYE